MSANPEALPTPSGPSPSLSLTGRDWRIAPADGALTSALARELGLPGLAARVLAARGFDPASAARWLACRESDHVHDPFALADMPAAVERAARAVEEGERIRVFGDYDADGVTSAAILVENLQAVGAEVDWRLPTRDHGYGIRPEDVDRALADGVGLMIAVDNGVTAFEAAARAGEVGLDLVVLDHHRPGERLPDAFAVVDPHREDDAYPFSDLSGAGLAVKFAQALQGADAGAPWRSSLVLAALGTIADVVTLSGENRWIVREGLRLLADTAARRPGIAALLQVAGVKTAAPTARDLGYALAPRLNAAGRVGDPAPALQCLLTDDPAEALALARRLEAANRERQRIERDILAAAAEEASRRPPDERVVVLGSEDWHPGVVGIVAGRLARTLYRPVLLAAGEGGRWHGSGRSIPTFDLHAALTACARHFASFGGHRQAGGFTMDVDALADLRRDMNAYAREVLSDEDLVPALDVDAVASLSDFGPRLVAFLDDFGPYGPGHARPRFAVPGLSVESRAVGRDGTHARLTCLDRNGFRLEGVAFGLGRELTGLPRRGRWALVASPEVDDYHGPSRIRLRVEDVRAEDGPDAAGAARPSAPEGGAAPRREALEELRREALEELRRAAALVCPGREELVRLYVECRDLARHSGPILPRDAGELAGALASRRAAGAAKGTAAGAANGTAAGAVAEQVPASETVAVGMRVFHELGLLVPLRQGERDVWVWTPPAEEKLDLAASATYGAGESVREALARLAGALGAPESVWRACANETRERIESARAPAGGSLRPAAAGSASPPGSRVVEVKHALIGATVTFEGTLVDFREGPGGRRLIYRFRLTQNREIAGIRLPAGGLTFGFFWEDRPYNVYFWLDLAGDPIALYFNVSDRTRISPDRVEWRDLVLDVLVPLVPAAPREAASREAARTDGGPWSGWIPECAILLDEDEVPPDTDPALRSRMEETAAHLIEHHRGLWREIQGCPALPGAVDPR